MEVLRDISSLFTRLAQVLKGNMHHRYDVSSIDAIFIIDLAADIFFWKFCIFPHFIFSSASLFLLISLTLPSPGWDGKVRLMRRKSEADEKVNWGDKMCLLAYEAKFLKTKSQRPHVWYKMHLMSSYNNYGAYSL